METKTHWEGVYTTKASTEVSWFQEHPVVSLGLIRRTGVTQSSPIIDVGGGASTLVDDLLAAGFQDITVLDLSAAALQAAKDRLGTEAAAGITWLEADITQAALPPQHFLVWHDRAVFHFLKDKADREKYGSQVRDSVVPGGHVIVATFAQDGPLRCSGLEVIRYSPDSLRDEFGSGFEVIEHTSEIHRTPFDTDQRFIYCYCRKK